MKVQNPNENSKYLDELKELRAVLVAEMPTLCYVESQARMRRLANLSREIKALEKEVRHGQ